MDLELREETKRMFRDVFSQYDETDEGRIQHHHLVKCLKFLGYAPTSEDDLEFLYNAFDTDGDGYLSIDEMMANLDVIMAHSIHGDDLVDCFKRFDTKGNGFVNCDVLELILTQCGDHRMSRDDARELIRCLLKEFDVNRDGKFSYPEFVRIVMKTDHLDKGQF